LNLTIAETGSLIVTMEEGVRSYISSVDPASGSVTSSKALKVRRNARILSAVWSPDGNQLVYNAVRGDFGQDRPTELYLHDERTGEERTLGPFPMIPLSVSWTRDAKALIMPVVSRAGTGVFRYWLDDGRMEELVPAKEGDPVARALPRLSADGRTVYYVEGSQSLNGSKLIRYDLASRTATTIATVNRAYDLASSGEMLAISTPDPSSKTETLRIVSKDGHVLRDLVRLKPEEQIVALTWSSDGRWVYFGLLSKGGADIRRISPSGGNSVSTGLRIGYLMHIAVHPSGAKIAYFYRSTGDLWRVDGITEALAKLP
jgi:Tol biopolymer transport system component